MMEAEKWNEYQQNYVKYGLDMKPKREPRERRQRKRAFVLSPEAKSKATDKKFIMAAVGIVGVVCICAIMLTAFCANLKYDINQIAKESNAVKGEIEVLEAQLFGASNIGVVESTATDELGMKYPGEDKRVYIYNDDIPQDGFSSVLREKAFN